jgi:hypothetical protein
MSLRISLVIVIVLSWAGVAAAYLVENPPTGPEDPEPPFFYNLSPDDMTRITIRAGDRTVVWVYRDDIGRWFFEDPENVPANLNRWGGITTLLGGPKTQRVLEESITDEAKFGLDKPELTITARTRDGAELALDIGRETTNSAAHYARVQGYTRLVLVDSSWGDVLERLVTEPPYPDWWYTMDPDKAHEVLYFKENVVVVGYGRSDADGKWYVCTLPPTADPCTGPDEADQAKVNELLRVIADRRIQGLEALDLKDQPQLEPYQATVDAPYFSIRIETEKTENITDVTRTSMTIGGLSPDGLSRYIVANETTDVVRGEAEWAGKILELFEEAVTESPAS